MPNAFGVEHYTEIEKRFFSEKSREKAAKKGDALPDGSFPIKNRKDLKNAERLVGRSKHPAAAEALIERKEKEFGVSKSVKTGLEMVANAGKMPSRSHMTGGSKRPTDALKALRNKKIVGKKPSFKVDNTTAETS